MTGPEDDAPPGEDDASSVDGEQPGEDGAARREIDAARREVSIPGVRDVVATLDEPAGDDGRDRGGDGDRDEDGGRPGAGAEAAVVACPPHPEYGGNRSDRRLRAVADGLVAAGLACLRFDYGPWDEGYGEVEDARTALRWAAERYDRVGVFGFSFGGGVAVLAAASTDVPLRAVALLAPGSRLADDLDAAGALDAVDAAVRVVYGERDTTANWEPLVERARELGCAVVALPADHFFVGQTGKVAEAVVPFLVEQVG